MNKHGKTMARIWENSQHRGRLSTIGLQRLMHYFSTVPNELKGKAYEDLEEELKKRGISNEF